MAIIKTTRLANGGDRNLIIQQAQQTAAGDIAYIIYPSAGVSRYGVGASAVQFSVDTATNVKISFSLCGLDAINNYLADQSLPAPAGIQEPAFVLADTLTADTFKEYQFPYTVMKAEFTGGGKALLTVAVA